MLDRSDDRRLAATIRSFANLRGHELFQSGREQRQQWALPFEYGRRAHVVKHPEERCPTFPISLPYMELLTDNGAARVRVFGNPTLNL